MRRLIAMPFYVVGWCLYMLSGAMILVGGFFAGEE